MTKPEIRPEAPVALAGESAASFRIATAVSEASSVADAIGNLAARLGATNCKPDFVTLHYGTMRAAEEVWKEAVAHLGCGALHGGSSCHGVMSDEGPAIATGTAIGAFAIWDPQGAYGTALEPIGDDPRAAAQRVTREALRRAGRPGEAPDLVWLTSAPGHEEALLEGIKDVIGRPALIVGGSSADNDVTGNWSQFAIDGIAQDAVVISVMFPSVPVACSFENGYAPTDKHGTVTRAHGRCLIEIDRRPAADVYLEWAGLPVRPRTESLPILSDASMCPLGRKSYEFDGAAFHLLVHPVVAHVDGRLELFAHIPEGEEIWLMSGSEDSLAKRAGRITAACRDQLPEDEVTGGLIVYCGGCMLSVCTRMDDVVHGICKALDDAPFLGVFSFGEQGETFRGDSEHGNLMVVAIVFGSNATQPRSITDGAPR
ncbi:FIST C-terminal domain-containing protein [Maritalea mobilis]|uniref:FIST signal transduction protein n=1 Tax=Maritalea mobilis TaxID=483324 RepID=UPI001C962D56|nr:FIST N-terminal domain-containing protein [Maritalea mobilis]MBY6201030.1 FIST C-terminal domain-containing protein [Maritalea mobilis]